MPGRPRSSRPRVTRKAAVLRAQGEAEAIQTVFTAIHKGDPDPKLLAYQYLQTLPKLAEGESNKLWIIPSEFTEALKGIGEGFFPAWQACGEVGIARAGDGFFSPAPPRVLAHRGLAIEAPENTLLAFAKALAVGVTHIETDVHVSADGVAMISHDPDLRALSDRRATRRAPDRARAAAHRPGLAARATARSRRRSTAFPTPGSTSTSRSAAPSSRRSTRSAPPGRPRRVLIGSFSPQRRLAAVRMLPGVATSISARRCGGGRRGRTQRSARGAVRRILRDVQAVQLPEIGAPDARVHPAHDRRFHAAGVEVHAWTINEPAAMDRLLALGVDGLVTRPRRPRDRGGGALPG